MIKLIIAGSRTIPEDERGMRELNYVYEKLFDSEAVLEVVSGTARGADKLGERWATSKGFPIVRFPANWDLYGKSAGHRRNAEMADYADAGIVLWDGHSRGARDMARKLRALNKPVYVHLVDVEPYTTQFSQKEV